MNKIHFLKTLSMGLLVKLSACQAPGNSRSATMVYPGDT